MPTTRFGDPGHFDPAEAGRIGGKKGGKSIRSHLSGYIKDNHMGRIEAALDKLIEKAESGDEKSLDILLRHSGMLKLPDEIQVEHSVAPTFVIGDPNASKEEKEEDKEV